MLIKILFLLLMVFDLYAQIPLKSAYYVKSKEIKLSSIVADVKNDFLIATIDADRYSQKIKSKELIRLLLKHGYKNYSAKSSYVNFILKSPVDTSLLEEKLKEYYLQNYEEITIESVFIEPRGYLESLPKEYSLDMRSRDFLSESGIVSIKTPQNKRLFFDYYVVADVAIYKSRDAIKKGTRLSLSNCIKKSVPLDGFRDRPLQNITQKQFQAKRHIPKDMILTVRDIEIFDVVKRDSQINVSLFQDGMAITFAAKALQDGKVNDIINVQNKSGKILKARVTGSGTAEIK